MDSLAYAMGTGGLGGGDGGGMGAFIPLILMFAIFYFLLIRPQQKKAKQQKAMLSSIKKGDRIVTSGGLHGVITGVDTRCGDHGDCAQNQSEGFTRFCGGYSQERRIRVYARMTSKE